MADEIADFDEGAIGESCDGGVDFGVGEVELGFVEGGLCALHGGFGGFEGGFGVDEFLVARDGVGLQFLDAVEIEFAFGDVGFGFGERGLGGEQGGFVGPALDGEEQIVFLDFGAVFEMLLCEEAGHARAELDRFLRGEAACEGAEGGDVLSQRCGDGDCWRWRGGEGVWFAATCERGERKREDGD